MHQSVEGALEKQDAKNNTNLNGENMSYQNENRSSKNDMKMEKEKLNKE